MGERQNIIFTIIFDSRIAVLGINLPDLHIIRVHRHYRVSLGLFAGRRFRVAAWKVQT